MNHYLIQLRPTRPGFPADATPGEIAIVGEHFQYLKGLVAKGSVLLVGRTDEEHPLGIALVATETELEAENIFKNDPAVAGGVMRGELTLFRLALAGKIAPT